MSGAPLDPDSASVTREAAALLLSRGCMEVAYSKATSQVLDQAFKCALSSEPLGM